MSLKEGPVKCAIVCDKSWDHTYVPYEECCQKTTIPIIYISDCGKLKPTFSQAAGQTTTTGQVSSIYYLPTFIWPNQIEYVFTIQFYL